MVSTTPLRLEGQPAGYVELHCHSNYSLLDGASHPEELVERAAELGMPALALTDHDAVYAAPAFIRAARQQGIRPILGAELTLFHNDPDDTHHLTLLVENQAGWHNLCYLISRARADAPKGQAMLPVAELTGCTTGLIALSGCRRGESSAALLRDGGYKAAVGAARRYSRLFGRNNFWIELQRHFLPDDDRLIGRLTALASYLKLGCVVTNNVHYHTPDRHRLHDVLVCIRHLTTLDASAHIRRTNAEYYLKSAGQMAALFPEHPQALANTAAIAERCQFQLSYGLQDLPTFPTPHGMSSEAYLRRLCQEALPTRYGDAPARVQEQLAHELEVIEQAHLSNYFLIVAAIVRFARDEGIRCQGRGSAANSLVAYLLHISPVDPIAQNLVFERFLSHERQATPDIDVDFDAQRREEVIQYIYRTYGADHAAMACTFVTFRTRSAIRDIGKALGLPAQVVATAVHAVEHDDSAALARTAEPDTVNLLLELSRQIEGFPRHLGIHSGGMVITGAPLMGRVPTEPATMEERVVVQWDKAGLEDVGLVKIDLLGLRMLSAISDAVALITEIEGVAPDIDGLAFTDPAVYQMISEADTIGVFQVESRAQAQVLPKLRPRRFDDLIVSISLIRPGPVQGNMVHPYLRRREGIEPVSYLHPLLEPALGETLGVVLFQEQVLKVARDLAGFTAGQGELLRRALGAKQATEEIGKFRDDFLSGAAANGVAAEVAEDVFQKLLAFGSYSFVKSHASAFAVLVYQSGWLKRYHPQAFYTALLNNQPMGFWNAAVIVNELRRQAIPVLPMDIHQSGRRCSVEEGGIRLGLNYVKHIAQEQIDRILIARAEQSFVSLIDFCRRTRTGRRVVENLIVAGAMDAWGIPRRRLVWELGTLHYEEGGFDLVVGQDPMHLPSLTTVDAMLAEQSVMGLSPGDHVMVHYRAKLRLGHILGSSELALHPGRGRVRVAGLLVVHQSPPTAKQFHFLTLEDEDGMINVIIRPAVYDQYRHVIHGAQLLVVEGQVQREGAVINVLAERISPLMP
ncbi:MAG: error-prone DNA polymerase [Candidatus Promineofilum sp.]|nr:error-prone DNA polymerase [Promineifilum sp.]